MPSRLRLAVSPESSWARAATSFSGSSGGFCAEAAPQTNERKSPMLKMRLTKTSKRGARHSSETRRTCRVFGARGSAHLLYGHDHGKDHAANIVGFRAAPKCPY